MASFQNKVVLVMAGGTGGHFYPALAVAKALEAEGAIIHWLGNAGKFEEDKVKNANFSFHDIKVKAIRGKGIIGLIRAPFMLAASILRAYKIIKKLNPVVVIGMGGFVSGPGGIAAKLARKKLAIHEQNAIMGMTNKYLAKWADMIFLADELAAEKAKIKSFIKTGNPVREDIANIPAPELRYPQRTGKIKLLVLGGSQGAKAINELLPETLALVDEEERPEVLHQCGKNWLEQTTQAYKNFGVKAEVVDFISDMKAAYENADWILARSGASTVAEIEAAGIPAVFVPFPYAVDDHQTANARLLTEAGAALTIKQADLSVDFLAQIIIDQPNREVLLKQAKIARSFSPKDAVNIIVENLKQLAISN